MMLQDPSPCSALDDQKRDSSKGLRLGVLWLAIGWAYVHLIAYAMMMVWFGCIYRSRRTLMVLGAFFTGLGVALEVIQGATGHRSMGVLDMAANACGVSIGWLIARSRMGNPLLWAEGIISGRNRPS